MPEDPTQPPEAEVRAVMDTLRQVRQGLSPEDQAKFDDEVARIAMGAEVEGFDFNMMGSLSFYQKPKEVSSADLAQACVELFNPPYHK